MEDYFEIVKKHTGYQGFPFLYTRGKDLKQYPQLVEKLLGFGLIPEIRIAHPSETFYGFGVYNADHSNVVKPSVGNLFFRTYLTEPQEPGIGLYFGKCIKHHRGIEITNHVFVRFVLPMHAIITGDGSRVSVANIETLDNALERGFRYPHQSRIFFNEPPGIVGNG